MRVKRPLSVLSPVMIVLGFRAYAMIMMLIIYIRRGNQKVEISHYSMELIDADKFKETGGKDVWNHNSFDRHYNGFVNSDTHQCYFHRITSMHVFSLFYQCNNNMCGYFRKRLDKCQMQYGSWDGTNYSWSGITLYAKWDALTLMLNRSIDFTPDPPQFLSESHDLRNNSGGCFPLKLITPTLPNILVQCTYWNNTKCQ